MKYIDFYQRFKNDFLIKTSDVFVLFPNFNIKDLSKWQKQSYIKKIQKGLYIFLDTELTHIKLFNIANNINSPSYIGLHSALSYYGIIPEGVFTITSISTKRTNKKNIEIGNFDYKSIKKDLFWGYIVKTIGDTSFYISELEKTILDFLYFYPNIKDIDDFKGLRLNIDELKVKINIKKIEKYLEAFNNKKLSERFYTLSKYINA